MLLLQVVIVVAFLALAAFSFGRDVLSPSKQGGMPERIGNLELVSTVAGAQALAQIDRLHGTDIKLVTAFIAEYVYDRYERQHATVWVGVAESDQAAAQLLTRMLDGITRGGSGFGNLQKVTVGGQEISQVDGPDGKHFFYQPREGADRVIWLSIEAADASVRPILEQAVKVF
ncbi:MAG: hypothetical protein Q8P00_00820 [Dehalococcoidia bacterium]|nr:hypothetical protein [Dehalococcoidia bacterium]